MKEVIEKVKSAVRGVMYELAKLLDMLTNGFIRPWHVTLVSLLGHVIVLLALTEGLFMEAAVLLAGFGLLDALDGAIARYQGSESPQGMLLDATTDRLKETLVFAGLAYYFVVEAQPIGALYAVLALGMSISVSYVKAKGEVALLQRSLDKNSKAINNINRELEFGIFGYEIRMLVLVVAFALSQPYYGVLVVAGGATLTFLLRFEEIVRRLNGKS